MMEEAEKIGRRIGVHFRVDIERRVKGAASVGAHRTSMLQDPEKGRAPEIDALLTVVLETGRLVDGETPTIDAVLALVQQMSRLAGLYPTFPEVPLNEEGAPLAARLSASLRTSAGASDTDRGRSALVATAAQDAAFGTKIKSEGFSRQALRHQTPRIEDRRSAPSSRKCR
jgi:hypothetical protein